MRSMTGFGRGFSKTDNGKIVVEIKTVNHRFLEIRTKMSSELAGIDTLVEKQIRKRLARGYCNVHITFERNNAGAVAISEDKLSNYILQLKQVANRTDVSPESLFFLLSAAPDVFEVPTVDDFDGLQAAAVTAVQNCLDELVAMRCVEGENMAQDVQAKLDTISNHINEISHLAKGLESSVFLKFQQKIQDILSEQQIPEAARLETEAAIWAEKADINEELTRLRSHVAQMQEVFKTEAPVGRRMDFLIQEMSRETNTIASKSILADITHIVVSIKGELEKIRELIQNVE